jgi:hypothetical protein
MVSCGASWLLPNRDRGRAVEQKFWTQSQDANYPAQYRGFKLLSIKLDWRHRYLDQAATLCVHRRLTTLVAIVELPQAFYFLLCAAHAHVGTRV